MESVLTSELATEIATETSAAAGYDVLLTDTTGLVIGSNVPQRLGTMHPPSCDVARTGRTISRGRAMISDEGVRPGITMPIQLNGEVVGTVGIAGPPTTVRRIGRLVQRQTQILLRESVQQRTLALHESAVSGLVRDISIFDSRLVDAQVLHARADELGISIRGPRCAIVVQATPTKSYSALARLVREVVPGRTTIVAETGVGRCTVLHAPDRASSAEDLTERCAQLAAAAADRLGTRIHVGVGSVADDLPSLQASCSEAAAAARYARQSDRLVCHVDQVRIPLLLQATPRSVRERYVRAVLGPLTDRRDADDLLDTIDAWALAGCSLAACAKRLGVHRNTVIYRLDKIESLLGRDLRRPADAVAAHLAVLARETCR